MYNLQNNNKCASNYHQYHAISLFKITMTRYVKPVAQQRATIIEPEPIKLSENLKKKKKKDVEKPHMPMKKNVQRTNKTRQERERQAHVISQKTRGSGTLMWSHCI